MCKWLCIHFLFLFLEGDQWDLSLQYTKPGQWLGLDECELGSYGIWGWHVGICHRSLSPSIHLWWYPSSSIVPQSSPPLCPFQSVLHWLGHCGKLGGLAVSAHILSPIYNIGTKKYIFVIKKPIFIVLKSEVCLLSLYCYLFTIAVNILLQAKHQNLNNLHTCTPLTNCTHLPFPTLFVTVI